MTDKYQNKYRTTSHRMPNWDYSMNGLYFITILTQNRVCNLEQIVNDKMRLSHFGKIVNAKWHKLYRRIKQYIIFNPKNWKKDKFSNNKEK